MMQSSRRTSYLRALFPVALALAATSMQAQFYKLHNGSISVGGTGQFSTVLTSNPSPQTVTYVATPQLGPITTTVSNQKQYTTTSTGFLASLQFHPVVWAGLELNYGFTRYSERYTYTSPLNPATIRVNVPTYWHEATGAYIVHPKFIPFQPYIGIGGGAIDFDVQDNQWRGAGLLEAGFDMPVHNTRYGFRVGGRSLYYRAPNFNSPYLSSRSWRVTTEPEVSLYYKF